MSNSLPSYQDAELILKLYDLRRESVMREARNWMATFNPQSIDDLMKVMSDFSNKGNAYLRQVCGYWEMVAAFIVHGTLNRDLAFDTLGEMYFVYAIMQPVIEEFRKKFNAPEFFKNVQQVVESTPQGRERIANVQKRRAEMMSRMAAAATQGDSVRSRLGSAGASAATSAGTECSELRLQAPRTVQRNSAAGLKRLYACRQLHSADKAG